MYCKEVTTTFYSPFSYTHTVKLPTLEQVLSVCIQPEDSFVVNFGQGANNQYDFRTKPGEYWNFQKLNKALQETSLTGSELVTDFSLSLDDDNPEKCYYIIEIESED